MHFRQIPPILYTLQNLLIIILSVILCILSCSLTLLIFLPASIFRAIIYLPFTILGLFQSGGLNLTEGQRNILIVGATEGLGRQLAEEYVNDPNTTVVAASRSLESLEAMRRSLSAPREYVAKVHLEVLDVSTTLGININDTMRRWEASYGPFTHIFSVVGSTPEQELWTLARNLYYVTI